jgi:hypothetical protein
MLRRSKLILLRLIRAIMRRDAIRKFVFIPVLFLLRAAGMIGGLGFLGYGLFVLPQHFGWTQFFIFSISFALCGGAYAGLDDCLVKATHAWSLEPVSSEELRQSVESSPYHRYCLFLRPLKDDADIRTTNVFNPARFLSVGFGLPWIDIQEWIMRSTGTRWRFVSQGGIRTNVRPVRLKAGADWKAAVEDAGSSVHAIILVPGAMPGIRWEYHRFLESRPERLIFLLPPKDNTKFYMRIKDGQIELPIKYSDLRSDGELILIGKGANGEPSYDRRVLRPKMLVHCLETIANTNSKITR